MLKFKLLFRELSCNQQLARLVFHRGKDELVKLRNNNQRDEITHQTECVASHQKYKNIGDFDDNQSNKICKAQKPGLILFFEFVRVIDNKFHPQ